MIFNDSRLNIDLAQVPSNLREASEKSVKLRSS
jgi:hypothetical protein